VLTTSDEGTSNKWEVLTNNIGRLIKDDYSRSNNDYIKYSNEDISQINVREAYN
jgi:hypothetical protein